MKEPVILVERCHEMVLDKAGSVVELMGNHGGELEAVHLGSCPCCEGSLLLMEIDVHVGEEGWLRYGTGRRREMIAAKVHEESGVFDQQGEMRENVT